MGRIFKMTKDTDGVRLTHVSSETEFWYYPKQDEIISDGVNNSLDWIYENHKSNSKENSIADYLYESLLFYSDEKLPKSITQGKEFREFITEILNYKK